MKKMLMITMLVSTFSFSAQAAVYNCSPKKTAEWNASWRGLPADFMNTRISIQGNKVSINMTNQILDVYRSCGTKEIGVFTEKNIVSETDKELVFEKEWSNSIHESSDGLILATKNRVVLPEMNFEYNSTCFEGAINGIFVCTKE